MKHWFRQYYQLLLHSQCILSSLDTHIRSLPTGGDGLHMLTVHYTLPPGANQAVRVNLRCGGGQSACFEGSWGDVNDLAFFVGTGSGMMTGGARKPNPVPEVKPL